MEHDNLISTSEVKTKQYSNNEINIYNINRAKRNMHKSLEINLLQEIRADSLQINADLKKNEDLCALEVLKLKSDENPTKKQKPARAPSVKGSAYTNEACNKQNSVGKFNADFKINKNNNPNFNLIKILSEKNNINNEDRNENKNKSER